MFAACNNKADLAFLSHLGKRQLNFTCTCLDITFNKHYYIEEKFIILSV